MAHDDGDAGFHLARIARKSGIVSERTGRYDAAIRWYGRARRLIGDDTSGGVHAAAEDRLATRLMIDVAGIRMRQGHYAQCVTRGAAGGAGGRAGRPPRPARATRTTCSTRPTATSAARRWRGTATSPCRSTRSWATSWGRGTCSTTWAIEAYFEGRWDEAVDLYRRSRDAKARAGDIANAATQSNNEAEVLSDQGRLDEAEALLRDALRVWSAAGYTIGVALATSNLGRVAARAGRHDEGLRLLEEAAGLFARIGAGGNVDETRARVAECLALARRSDDARAVASETILRVRRESEQSVLAIQLERTLAWAALLDGVPSAASIHAAASLREARALGAAYEVAVTLETLAALPGRPAADVDRERAEAAEIFAGLGVVAVPAVPAR